MSFMHTAALHKIVISLSSAFPFRLPRLFSLPSQVLICKSAEVDPTHYVDPKSKQVFGFNHITQVYFRRGLLK